MSYGIEELRYLTEALLKIVSEYYKIIDRPLTIYERYTYQWCAYYCNLLIQAKEHYQEQEKDAIVNSPQFYSSQAGEN